METWSCLTRENSSSFSADAMTGSKLSPFQLEVQLWQYPVAYGSSLSQASTRLPVFPLLQQPLAHARSHAGSTHHTPHQRHHLSRALLLLLLHLHLHEAGSLPADEHYNTAAVKCLLLLLLLLLVVISKQPQYHDQHQLGLYCEVCL